MAEPQLRCMNPGCNGQFIESENNETACRWHPGAPIFHDLKKGWKCCDVVVYDWDEFALIPGCAYGRHSTVKPQQTEFFKSTTVSNARQALAAESNPVVIKSVTDYNKVEEEKKAAAAEKPREIVYTKEGLPRCGNMGGCGQGFDPDNNDDETACRYHAGTVVFHDVKKYWTCCPDRVTYDWDDFQAIPTCVVGKHNFKYK